MNNYIKLIKLRNEVKQAFDYTLTHDSLILKTKKIINNDIKCDYLSILGNLIRIYIPDEKKLKSILSNPNINIILELGNIYKDKLNQYEDIEIVQSDECKYKLNISNLNCNSIYVNSSADIKLSNINSNNISIYSNSNISLSNINSDRLLVYGNDIIIKNDIKIRNQIYNGNNIKFTLCDTQNTKYLDVTAKKLNIECSYISTDDFNIACSDLLISTSVLKNIEVLNIDSNNIKSLDNNYIKCRYANINCDNSDELNIDYTDSIIDIKKKKIKIK